MALDTGRAVATLRSLTAKFDNKIAASTPFYPEVCTIVPSDGADEEYGLLGNMPGVREWLGDRIYEDLRAAKYTLANKHWESSLLISKNDIEDDRMGLYGPLLEQLAIEAAYHPDELLFETAIVTGDAVACFDGQFFFDTDHAFGDSGTQSNKLTYNATDHTAVTATEFRSAYHAARKKLMTYKNDKGKLLNRPVVRGMDGLMLVVPPDLEEAAAQALNSIIISNSSNIVLDKPRLVVSPHLTSAVKFYLFKVDGPIKPFVFQARKPLSRQVVDLNNIETKHAKFLTEARYNIGYGAWWTAVLTEFN